MFQVLHLKPVIYSSRGKSLENLRFHLESYPEQDINTIQGIHHTVEFKVFEIPGYGSLTEIRKVTGADEFIIQCSDGTVVVKYDSENNNFKIVNQTNSNEGCTCQECGNKYMVDIIVPDDIWEEIKPYGKPKGSGLLCGQCIFRKIENLKQFSSFQLVTNRSNIPCDV